MSIVGDPSGVSLSFGQKDLQEIDVQIPRKISFSKSAGEVKMENISPEGVQLTDAVS